MNKGLILMALVAYVFSMQFSMQIQYSSLQCFSHLITESTPFHFKVQADNSQFQLSLMFRDGTILMKKQGGQTIKKIDSYAAVTDTYTFCIQNSADKQQFIISFYHGLQLSDINALPKQEDHHLIDKLVDQLNKIYQTVREQALYSKTMNEYNMQLQKLVSFKYVGFGFLSITVVLIISFLHYLQIKRVLRTRKVI